jgi:integrase
MCTTTRGGANKSFCPAHSTPKNPSLNTIGFAGRRKQILLPGAFNSKESLAEYHRLCTLLRANHGRLLSHGSSIADLTVSELILRYMRYMDEFAKSYYVHPDTKEPTSEIECLSQAFRPLNRLFGSLPVAEFDSLKVETLQNAMATGVWLNEEERKNKEKQKKPLGVARSTINRHVDRIKRLFRWGCVRKFVPADNLVNLEAVASLRQGRSIARETAPVKPVDVDVVHETLQFLPPVTADIVRLLLLTGARVGELCRLRGREIGSIWLYHVTHHKTLHHGHSRTIAFGPNAQLILRRHLKDDPDALLFSPADQDRLIKERQRTERKTPVQPSQRDRSKKNPQRKPGDSFTAQAINHAIRRACSKAGVSIWHTHQLRHSAALVIMREHGIEAARSVLGHKTLNMALHYSGIDLERAKEVAAKVG